MTLQANLFKLWKAGYVYFPIMAKSYEEIGSYVRETWKVDSKAFSMPGSDTASPALGSWTQLRESMQYILDQSCINLLDTGDGILQLIESYKESDEMTADQIEELEGEISDYPKNKSETDPDNPQDTPPEGGVTRPDGPKGIDMYDPETASDTSTEENHGGDNE